MKIRINGNTPAYYIEKYIGLFIGIAIGIYCFKTHHCYSFINNDKFLDKLITICTTMFGFLLTVLTLIIQSNSETIIEMKKHLSYKRLINFNKKVVFLSAIVCIISLFLAFIIKKLDSINPYLSQLISLLNYSFFIWMMCDTLIFVSIFYKILISDIPSDES